MPSGVYERTPEMKNGKYKRTPEHNAANSKAHTGVPLSPEHRAAQSKAGLGIPNTPEHNAAIKKGMEESEAVKAYHESTRGIPHAPEWNTKVSEGRLNSESAKASTDAMRGGNDLVNHHYIYDHSDLSSNTVQMTRSDHMKLHCLLRKLGYAVPHINVGV